MFNLIEGDALAIHRCKVRNYEHHQALIILIEHDLDKERLVIDAVHKESLDLAQLRIVLHHSHDIVHLLIHSCFFSLMGLLVTLTRRLNPQNVSRNDRFWVQYYKLVDDLKACVSNALLVGLSVKAHDMVDLKLDLLRVPLAHAQICWNMACLDF